MTYETINKVGSPRIHLLNTLKEKNIFSEFPKEGFTKIIDESGYYFSEELLEKDFNLKECIYGKTSQVFMKVSGYSRPKINTYIEKHGRIIFISPGYYNLDKFRIFVQENIKQFIERRGRPRKI